MRQSAAGARRGSHDQGFRPSPEFAPGTSDTSRGPTPVRSIHHARKPTSGPIRSGGRTSGSNDLTLGRGRLGRRGNRAVYRFHDHGFDLLSDIHADTIANTRSTEPDFRGKSSRPLSLDSVGEG